MVGISDLDTCCSLNLSAIVYLGFSQFLLRDLSRLQKTDLFGGSRPDKTARQTKLCVQGTDTVRYIALLIGGTRTLRAFSPNSRVRRRQLLVLASQKVSSGGATSYTSKKPSRRGSSVPFRSPIRMAGCRRGVQAAAVQS